MTSPQEKHYEAVKAELDETADIHPLGGGPVDEYIALTASGQHVAAEATLIAAAANFRDTLTEWRRQAAETEWDESYRELGLKAAAEVGEKALYGDPRFTEFPITGQVVRLSTSEGDQDA